MEENTKEKEALSQDEKIEFLKNMFSTLEVDKKAVFTQWCHEEVEKGAGALLGQKLQDVNDKMNSFIARASDQIGKGAKFAYDNTNKLFEADETPKKEIKKTSKGGHSFFD